MATPTSPPSELPSDPPSPHRLVLVQSRIRPSPPAPSLSPATFHEWYNTVHIPDLLQTPGVRSAIRYAVLPSPSSPDDGSDGSFPFIALYPSLPLAWLTSPTCEFLRVPLHHPMLPGPSHFVFDVADFVIGAYVVRGAVGEWAGSGAPGAVVVEVVGEGEVRERGGVEGVLEARRGFWGEGRTVVLEWDFSPAGKGVRTEEVEGGRLVVGGRVLVLVSSGVFCSAFVCFSGMGAVLTFVLAPIARGSGGLGWKAPSGKECQGFPAAQGLWRRGTGCISPDWIRKTTGTPYRTTAVPVQAARSATGFCLATIILHPIKATAVMVIDPAILHGFSAWPWKKLGKRQHTSCACFSEDWAARNRQPHRDPNCHWQDLVFAGRRLWDI